MLEKTRVIRPGIRSEVAARYAMRPATTLPLPKAAPNPPVLRRELGEVLRQVRQNQGKTLREVSADARVSLGYLSEVERGQKEASSELLAAICSALDAPLSVVLREVSERIAALEGLHVPDSVPEELLRESACGSGCCTCGN